jgi:excisionase family DNA binding protein
MPLPTVAPSNRRDRRHPRWATVEQTAEHLGVTGRTVRQMTADGRLTRYTLGRRIIRYDLNEVDDALLAE